MYLTSIDLKMSSKLYQSEVSEQTVSGFENFNGPLSFILLT